MDLIPVAETDTRRPEGEVRMLGGNPRLDSRRTNR